MKNSISAFLSDSEKEDIINAVKEAEKKTSGEIVPFIVPDSYTYPASGLLGSLVISIIEGTALCLLLGTESIWLFLSVFIPLFIVNRWLLEFLVPLKRLFISSREMEEEVREAAVTAFYESGLYRTRDETGVLVFISVFERKVWVLADRGINEKVEKHVWQNAVNIITGGIKNKRQGQAIVEAVTEIGEILAGKFPVKKDDTDELDNLIIRD